MRRRGSASIVANPVLVGAVTTLVVVVAVFLAYNANNGLPFVPTRTIFVQLNNGSELVAGNEVREGGYRVGVVNDMKPKRLKNGHVGAILELKLDKKAGEVPVDSRVVVRQRSSLGLKYVQLSRGTSPKALPDGATLPVRQTTTPVDLDEVYNMFDRKTREGSAENLVGFGDAFAGRGDSLHEFIAEAPQLFGVLAPVMHNLADPRTHLAEFFQALERTASTVAPVADVYARTFKETADTFAAIDRDPQALKDTIAKSPPTLDVSTRSLRVQRPFLNDTTLFSRDLRAAAQDLKPTLPVVNSALEIGTPVQRRSVELDKDLQRALVALRDLAREPTTNAALRGLTDTIATLNPQLRFYGPYVTVCNNWNWFWTLVAEHFSAVVPGGTAERALLNSQGQQRDSVGSQGAVHPAAGRGVISGDPQFAHEGTYGSAIIPGGAADCEAGQQGYESVGNPFTADKHVNYKHVVWDTTHQREGDAPHYKRIDENGKGQGGLDAERVPKGQTYTVFPEGRGVRLDTEPPKR